MPLNPNSQITTREDSDSSVTVQQRRTRKRSSSLTLDDQQVKLKTPTKSADPASTGASRAKREAGQIAQGYAEQWEAQLPAVDRFMGNVLTSVESVLLGDTEAIESPGVSFQIEDEAA